MPFERDVFIPFHLVDAAGVIFFSHVFTLAHQVFESYISECLHIPWEQWFQNDAWIVPIKQTDATYYKPLLAGQPCSIRLQVTELKTSSFQICYQFYQQEWECCRVKSVHVFCDRLTGKKREIPESIRPLFRL